MKRFVALSQPQVDECGLAEYRLTLDVEGRAVLEAALGPLSAPQPVDGERDLRPSDQRRGEALVALVRRAVASADATPRNTKSQLFVTVDLETLRNGLRGAGRDAGRYGVGNAARARDGAPAGLRRHDHPHRAGGGRGGGRPRDGRAAVHRGPDQAAVAARPALHLSGVRHARVSGATRITWFIGPTAARRDLDNAALLCERHHTIVHTRRYAGRLVEDRAGTRVEWDLRPGSYDELLARLAVQEPA